jgi:hypothetical protein
MKADRPRNRPNPESPPSRRTWARYRKTYAVGIVALVATLYLSWAWGSAADAIHVQVVNKSGAMLTDLAVQHKDAAAKRKRWGPGDVVKLDIQPLLLEPIMIEFTDEKENLYASRLIMREQRDVPRPGDTLIVSIIGVADHAVSIVPQVVRDEGPFRRVRELFGK